MGQPAQEINVSVDEHFTDMLSLHVILLEFQCDTKGYKGDSLKRVTTETREIKCLARLYL